MTRALKVALAVAVISAWPCQAQWWAGGSGASSVTIFSPDKAPGTPASQKTEYANVAAAAEKDILLYSGSSGYVSSIWIGISYTDAASVTDATLKVYYDGSPAPSISAPLVLVCASEYLYNTNVPFMSTWLGGSSTSGSNLGLRFSIPIPFSTGIRVSVTNGSATTAITLWSVSQYHTGVANNLRYTKRLLVSTGRVSGIVADAVTTLINVTPNKRGRYAGMYLNYDGFPGSTSPRSAPLEGNVKVYLDGAASPTLESSGTEDYFQMSLYFQGYTAPYVGGEVILHFKTADTYAASRLHVYDPIVFNNALKVTWNNGDTTQVPFTGTSTLAYCVWYYTE